MQHSVGDLGKNVLGNTADFVQNDIKREAVHEFHANGDLSLTVEGAVEAHNVWAVAVVQDFELLDDLVTDRWLHFQTNEL